MVGASAASINQYSAALQRRLSAIRASVLVRELAGDGEREAGLVVCGTESRAYAFVVHHGVGGPTFRVSSVTPETIREVDKGDLAAATPGRVNGLRVDCAQSENRLHLTFRVNGVVVHRSDQEPTDGLGSYGLLAAGETGRTTVLFDDLLVEGR